MAVWAFGPVVILFSKKSHSSKRVWVQSLGSSNISVCEFRLEFLSYIYIKKKKRNYNMYVYFGHMKVGSPNSALQIV